MADSTNDNSAPPVIARLKRVPVQVTVELGRRRMRIAELLQLGPGSVIELQSAAGEPLDVRVNDRLVARGEAVSVGDSYGVRIVEVVSSEEKSAAADQGDPP
ncbi:MAG: flagellar motor switch protein FliN [Deltaproteobacteria bacterium]|nr:flagellar motor switch protein FliN [Deltaproteobacteria bacterium]